MKERPIRRERPPNGGVTAAVLGVPALFGVGVLAVSTAEPLGMALGAVWGPVAAGTLIVAVPAACFLVFRAAAVATSRKSAGRRTGRGNAGRAGADASGERLTEGVEALARLLGFLAARGGGELICERDAAATVAARLLPDGPAPAAAFLAAFDAGAGIDGPAEFAALNEMSALARWCAADRVRGAAAAVAACHVAGADGHITADELAVLKRFDRAVCGGGFDPAAFAESTNADSPYTVLGLTPPCSRGEVRRAYRRKAAEFHPDRLARQDVPDELRAFGEARYRSVSEAYERLKAVLP